MQQQNETAMFFHPIDIFPVFMVLFAVIDIIGSIPVIISLIQKHGAINPAKATIVSFGIMIAFLFLGEPLLTLFGVNVSLFAIAGSFVLFFLSLEMVLGLEFFKPDTSPSSDQITIFPIAFPLIAGAGSMTTLVSLQSQYHVPDIILALVLNMVVVYFVLRSITRVEKMIGKAMIVIIKKLFGLILMAIAIKLFVANTGIHLTK